MKILISGGLGFIFSYATEYFVKQGYEVVVMDNCSVGSHLEIADGSFKLLIKDVADDDAFEFILRENPDYIVHAAAITDVDFSIKNPRQTFQNNVLSTLNVFKVAKQMPNLKKLLYVNTDEVYGECKTEKTEEEILFPRNPYSASKATGSFIRYSYDNTYEGLKDRTAEIRMCNIFGQRQAQTKIMPQIIASLKNGYSIPLQNGGVGYREYLYVENIPPIIEMVLKEGNRVYNITNNDGFTVNDLIKRVEGISGKKVVTHSAKRPGHDKFYRMSNKRLKDKFNWKPLFSFDEGIKKYLKLEGL